MNQAKKKKKEQIQEVLWLAVNLSPLRSELLTQLDFEFIVPTRLVGNDKMFNIAACVGSTLDWQRGRLCASNHLQYALDTLYRDSNTL